MAVTDINLPPLPSTEWLLHMPARPYEREWTSHETGYADNDMQDYARAAVLADRAARAPKQAEPTRGDWDRFHHVMHKHGLHPGRTDDDLIDLLDRALSEVSPPAPQQAEPSYFGLTHGHTWLSVSKEQYDKLKPQGRMACVIKEEK
jgi:hypothetical protein